MRIGVPKEVLNNENRIGLTPAGVYELVGRGNEVYIEKSGGEGSGFTDQDYINVGAKVVSKDDLFDKAELIVKVKEFLEEEFKYLKEGQIIFTYLHIANNKRFTDALLEKKVTAIAYETVRSKRNTLPLLTPMSEVAGRMSVQIGANLLQKFNGGAGLLLGGVPGVMPAEVVIIGGGTVGFNAARIASGLGAQVHIFDIDAERMAYIDEVSNGTIHTIYNNKLNLSRALKTADLVIGAVLIPGSRAPKLVTEEMVKEMKKGSVIVDVAIDQGGIVETCDRITSHKNPTFEKYGVIHYTVPNMPGAVPKTSTTALSNATLPYILKLAENGLDALKEDEGFLEGLNTYQGKVTCKGVAESFGYKYYSPKDLIK